MAWSDTASILNDARVTRQELGNALSSGLTELRGSLEQIRQEVLESGNATFTTLRDENRELRGRLNKANSELAEVRQEIARTRADIAGLRSHLTDPARPAPAAPGPDGPSAVAAAPAPAELPATPAGAVELPAQRQPSDAADRPAALHHTPQEPGPVGATQNTDGQKQDGQQPPPPDRFEDREDQEDGTDREDVAEGLSPVRHGRLLLAAARISSAKLVCHRDTFAFLVQQSVGDPHFHVPGRIEDVGEGRVQAALSGRSLIATLTSLWRHRGAEEKETTGNWALAVTLYLRIAGAIEGAAPGPMDSDPVAITLDDRSADPRSDTAKEPAA